MARAKPEVAGKTAKAKATTVVRKKHTIAEQAARSKRLEKRVAKLEKEKEEEKGHAKTWRATMLREQRDFTERVLGLFSEKINGPKGR